MDLRPAVAVRGPRRLAGARGRDAPRLTVVIVAGMFTELVAQKDAELS
ncbi:hypothetical protein PSCLAVI8L_180046 [Pseudoclavibacter sp. 8L]|nr:hypothetical protein PSCLAVI8L_180046 [Pseudoclavibacter sp. 8L]